MTGHKTIAVCLLAAVCVSAWATPSVQQDPDAVDRIRQQVESFQQRDRLKVKLHDGSETTGCLASAEPDGFVIGGGHAWSQRIPYGDVADVRKDKRGFLNKVLRTVVSVAAVAGAVFGVMKIGSNTPKTMVVKVHAASAVAYIGGMAASAQACR